MRVGMAQGFAWKDFLSLPRYRDQQQYLDNELRLLYTPGLFSSILLSVVAPASGYFTTVQHLEDSSTLNLMGQLYHPANQISARLAFLAPKMEIAHPGFTRLLAYLSKQAGERGAYQILAEVPQGEVIEETLYQGGFRPYAEQTIWMIFADESPQSGTERWCPITGQHQESVISLYNRVTPHQVQRVEPPPRFPDLPGLVTMQGDEVVGCARPTFGPQAILVDIVLAPDLPELDRHLTEIIHRLPRGYSKVIYFRVRAYQPQLETALESLGARSSIRQTAVVKKLVLHANAKQAYPYQAFEKQPDITTPISNTTLKET